MGKVEKRYELLLEKLQELKTLKLSEIEEIFAISPATARRMCVELEKQGKVLRCFGGIQSLPQFSTDAELPSSEGAYRQHASEYLAEKQLIAEESSKYVGNGNIIFISSGTTTYQFALALAARIRRGELRDIVVMTNSFDHADVLGKDARVILTGGDYRPIRRDLSGMICEKSLSKSRFDRAFIGVDGIDVQGGLMTFDLETARIDQIVLTHSVHTYILTDHSKFDRSSFISYSTIEEKCTIVTDAGLPEEIVARALKAELDLVLVGAEQMISYA